MSLMLGRMLCRAVCKIAQFFYNKVYKLLFNRLFMEYQRLEYVLSSPAVKIIDTNVILRDREFGEEGILLRHLYDRNSLRSLFSWVLEEANGHFENSYFFFNFPGVYFTEGIIKEVSYVLECVNGTIDFFKFRRQTGRFANALKKKVSDKGWRKNQESCERKEELLLETQETLYEIVSRMKERKISFENGEKNNFSKLHRDIINIAEKNKLKIDNSLKYDAPKSRKVKDEHTDEEIVAAGLVLSQKGERVKIISDDWDISNIVNYIRKNYEWLDSGLFGEIKGELQVFRPDRFSADFAKTGFIPRFTGEKFGEGLVY